MPCWLMKAMYLLRYPSQSIGFEEASIPCIKVKAPLSSRNIFHLGISSICHGLM